MPKANSNPDELDLGYVVRLEPKEAVDYFRAKGYAINWNWQESLHAVHARAFTVAKAMNADVLTTLRNSVDEALAGGMTEQDFTRQLMPELQKLGWWGKANIDGQDVTLGTPARLGTIYRTNMTTCYQAGRYVQQLNQTNRPYWQYLAIEDESTRDSHAVLNKRIFLATDIFWQTHYPPLDWGCRCRVRAMSKARMEELGLSVESADGLMTPMTVDAGTDALTGEQYQVEVMKFKSVVDGKEMNIAPAPGWSYNVGAAAFGTDVSVARKIVEMESRPLRQQLIQSLNNSPVRLAEFGEWVAATLGSRRAGNIVQPVAFMDDELAQIISDRSGRPPARLMVVSEKQLIHADSSKHQVAEIALTPSELQALPLMISQPRAVLWDTQHDNLMFIADSDNDDRPIKIAVDMQQSVKKQPDKLDTVINAYYIKEDDIKSGVAGGQYELLRGSME